MNAFSPYAVWVFLAAAAIALATYGALRWEGPVLRIWRAYVRRLADAYEFLLIQRSPTRLAALHLATLAFAAILALAFSSLALALVLPALAMAPLFVLQRKRDKRLLSMLQQLAPWLAVLANSLKAAPSIGDALKTSIALSPAPISEEIDLIVKEVGLGVPVNEALRNASRRVGDPTFSSVMTTLLVARQSGGQLPAVLAQSASTLREMERLEGVVRTKTAEGKSQTYVLAGLPFLMCALLHKLDPAWIPQLTESFLGAVLLSISGLLWLSAVFAARKILAVEL